MDLFFNGAQIPGEYGPLMVPSPEIKRRTVRVWQLVGEAEVIGKPAGRTIMVRVLLHDEWEQPEFLQEYLRLMDSWVGTNGTLKAEGESDDDDIQPLNHEYKFCTFEGYEMDPETPGPLPDVAGTVDDQVGTWFVIVWLRFRQLVPKLKI